LARPRPPRRAIATGWAGRWRSSSPRKPRASSGRSNNHFEGLILFGIACTVITVSGQSSGFTTACAWTYLAARVLYVPAYYFGWAPWRSLIWFVGFAATTLILLAALI
jgi:uncharacterized MAPEG superfamily protein